ncbi:MAG: SsrA-binding protein SmpB [Candidatus Sungbacteria bacterium]|nr:SsrA-binding protein SmpB [Candidatus Sungbacteria bacterium]
MEIENRRAYFEYEILETYEAGVELLGFEVKAIRAGRAVLSGAFVVPRGNELWLTNISIAPYQAGNTPKDYLPDRPRRLLMHRKEIASLIGKSRTAGLTLIPLRFYTEKPKIKVQIGVARKKRKYDKREAIKKRDTLREARRTLQ